MIGGVISGRIARPDGAVTFQGFNVLLKAIETERKLEEAAVREEFEELKRELGLSA